MLLHSVTIGVLILFAAMSPGPDFAIVTRNTLAYSRRAGIFTAIGVASAIVIHVTYCVLGLAILISQSVLLFNLIKYIGATYLVYLGFMSFISDGSKLQLANIKHRTKSISDFSAVKQGFFCNLLNPKATMFFLALFTAIIKPGTLRVVEIFYAIEVIGITLAWFIFLVFILTHPRVTRLLSRAEKYIPKILGLILIAFGVALAMFRHH